MLKKQNKRIVRSKPDFTKKQVKSLIVISEVQEDVSSQSPSKSEDQINQKKYFIGQEFMEKMVNQKIIPFVTTNFSLIKKVHQESTIDTKAQSLAAKVIFRIFSKKTFQFYAKKLFRELKNNQFAQKIKNFGIRKIYQFSRIGFNRINSYVKLKSIRIATQKLSRLYFRSQIIRKSVAFWSLKMRAKEIIFQSIQSIERLIHRKLVICKFQGFRSVFQYANRQNLINTRKTKKKVPSQEISIMVTEFNGYVSQQEARMSAKQLQPDVINIKRCSKKFQENKKINIGNVRCCKQLSKDQIYKNVELTKFRERLLLRRSWDIYLAKK